MLGQISALFHVGTGRHGCRFQPTPSPEPPGHSSCPNPAAIPGAPLRLAEDHGILRDEDAPSLLLSYYHGVYKGQTVLSVLNWCPPRLYSKASSHPDQTFWKKHSSWILLGSKWMMRTVSEYFRNHKSAVIQCHFPWRTSIGKQRVLRQQVRRRNKDRFLMLTITGQLPESPVWNVINIQHCFQAAQFLEESN